MALVPKPFIFLPPILGKPLDQSRDGIRGRDRTVKIDEDLGQRFGVHALRSNCRFVKIEEN